MLMHEAATLTGRKAVADDVIDAEHVRAQLRPLSTKLGIPLSKITSEAEKGLREIVAVKSRAFSYLFDHVLGPMHTRAWTLDVDIDGLERVKALGKKGTGLVFLPTHRSYADAFILTQVLRNNGMPRHNILRRNNERVYEECTYHYSHGGELLRTDL